MLNHGKHSQAETKNPSSSASCLSQNTAVSQNNPHRPSSDSHQSRSFLSCSSPQNQSFSHDTARHFASPPRPLNLQRPTELCLSAPDTPLSRQHCETRPVLLNDAPMIGRPRGNTCIAAFPASSVAQTHPPTSSPLAPCPPFHCPSSPSPPSNARTDSTIFPPSQAQLLWSLCEGSDLTLLNQCLHHIISLRNSSPNLSKPVNKQGSIVGSVSAIHDNRDRSQSVNVPLRFNPSQDKSSLSTYDIKGRPSLPVG